MDLSQQPAMIVLQPGNKVLVALREDPEPELAQEFARTLHQSFPGCEFVIMGGVEALAVQATEQTRPTRRVG